MKKVGQASIWRMIFNQVPSYEDRPVLTGRFLDWWFAGLNVDYSF